MLLNSYKESFDQLHLNIVANEFVRESEHNRTKDSPYQSLFAFTDPAI